MVRSNSYLGKSNWGQDAMLKGSLDDFKVFPRVLRDDEISCLGSVCTDECTNGLD